jgi:hypothetical protein
MPSDSKPSDGKHNKPTVSTMDKYHGSKLFEQAAFTIGLDEFVRRLRLLAPPEEAGAAFARLRTFVLSWEE